MVSAASLAAVSCDETPKHTVQEDEFHWNVDKFDDINVLRYQVPGFEELTLEQKKVLYYLGEAAQCGRDIIYDQNFKYNLVIRRTLEAMYQSYEGDREDLDWLAFEKYLKKVWFANGIHHHYSMDKFEAEFSTDFFGKLFEATPDDKLPNDFGTRAEIYATIQPVIFDPSLYPIRVNQEEGKDLLLTSAMNYYEGVTQKEAEAFYTKMTNPKDPHPISIGLNSKLVKDENGDLVEHVWKVGGMYTGAIEKIIYWLDKAANSTNGQQKEIINTLISYYKSGDLGQFDEFNILWVQDTLSKVDFINGFTENYGDPLGYKSSWESLINFKDDAASVRTEIISENAQWFEDNSPVQDKYKKPNVKGISAKVINATMLGGDTYPATAIGVNLPNADWIRKEHGSKSVTIENIMTAYSESSKESGLLDEYYLREDDRNRILEYGRHADYLHTDLHECLGHASGQLAPGVKGDELRQYGSTLEEARADLFALYYIADPKLVELGVVPNMEMYKAQYAEYIVNGLMTQMARIKPGKNVEEAHMRNRQLIAAWAFEMGKKDNVIERVEQDGKTYFVVNDFEKLRELFGKLLREIQRIKSEGDFKAGSTLVETYGVKVDQKIHDEVLARHRALKINPYSGFVNPRYLPVMENGQIVDVKIDYSEDYISQMLRYSNDYSYLPSKN